MIGFKLLKQRVSGTLGPLFINARQVIPIGEWLQAEDHPTKGYAHRPGWHITNSAFAPHLKTEGRVWAEVEFEDFYEFQRPAHQGGIWYIAQRMKVIKIM
jgi:hypothetical protein